MTLITNRTNKEGVILTKKVLLSLEDCDILIPNTGDPSLEVVPLCLRERQWKSLKDSGLAYRTFRIYGVRKVFNKPEVFDVQ